MYITHLESLFAVSSWYALFMPISIFGGCGIDLGSNVNSVDFCFYIGILHVVRMWMVFPKYSKQTRIIVDFSLPHKRTTLKNYFSVKIRYIDNVYIHKCIFYDIAWHNRQVYRGFDALLKPLKQVKIKDARSVSFRSQLFTSYI